MTDSEIKKLSLADAVQLIVKKKISAQELTQAVISRIERLNPNVRAFITVMSAEISALNGPVLHGVPLSVKDLYDIKGIPTTAGSKVFADRFPAEDAVVVKKLKDAGGVIVGKTNLHECAFGVTTINPHYGTAHNPWNRERISGGSSGGSASAVALGLGFGSMGTDTGGSIRIPASLCGIVGLKPTYGLLSLRGVFPLSWSLDHAGPMTRTVQDAAIMMEILASPTRTLPRYTDALSGTVQGLRVGIPEKHFYERIAPSVESAVRAAITVLQKLGAKLVRVDMPGVDVHRAVWLQIASPEAYSYHETHLQKHPSLYGADVRGRLEAGRALLSADYVRAQRARALIRNQCRDLFRDVDVVVTPTVPIAAPRIDEVHKPWSNEPETASASLTRLTRFFNVAGLPAISIPCGFTSEDLPVGMQIAGKAFDELTVLQVAYAYERETRWFERTPAI